MQNISRNYRTRIIDKIIEKRLELFGAVCIEGPKWCGKTWTSLVQSNSVFFVGNPENNFSNKLLAELNVNSILKGSKPRLIDEWQEVPAIWDAVRMEVDLNGEKGSFILTGSSTPSEKGVLHSGTGRIDKVRMRPMTLFESGDSNGRVSLKDLFNNNLEPEQFDRPSIDYIIHLVVRGGWPGNISVNIDDAGIIPKSYVNSLLTDESISLDGIKRNKNKMYALLRSLSRNESTTVSNKTLVRDIKEIDEESISPETLKEYLDILERIFLIENQQSFAPKIRSHIRVAKSAKRHLVDPSLAVALLDLTPKMLLKDLEYFGFLFESLVYRDINVYAESIGGKTYHYRNLSNNEEVDIIVENEDGEYAAFEVKLGTNQIEQAAKQLIKFKNSFENEENKPKVLGIICGVCDIAYQRSDGVMVIPITSLRP